MGVRSTSLLPLLLFLLLVGNAAGAQGLKERGAALLEGGRFEEARALGLDAVNADPADMEGNLLLCQSLVSLGRPADAANYAAKAWERRRDPRLAELLGEAFYFLGRNPEALSWFQAYLSSMPEGARAGLAYYYTGELYVRLGRFGHADIAFLTAVRHDPGNARWWVRLGWAQEKAGDPSQALRSYDKACVLDPRLEDATIGKERVLARLRG